MTAGRGGGLRFGVSCEVMSGCRLELHLLDVCLGLEDLPPRWLVCAPGKCELLLAGVLVPHQPCDLSTGPLEHPHNMVPDPSGNKGSRREQRKLPGLLGCHLRSPALSCLQ